jgi:membrane carboxypeptidase/penicillin-binding protein
MASTERLIEPTFLRAIEEARGRIRLKQIKSECYTNCPTVNAEEIHTALDQLALDLLMKNAAYATTHN